MASSYQYDHNTAHILEPVQGYDIVSFMNFWAPLDETVEDAVPGTVMHRNKDGFLVRGLTKTSMAQFLYSKQDTEDVINNPVTANGLDITSVSMNSYGDFPGYVQPYGKDGFQNGVCSNISGVTFDQDTGVASPVIFHDPQSAYTTFPGACGLELGSSEFAFFEDDETTPVKYEYDMPLTSPTKTVKSYEDEVLEADGETQSDYGTAKQRAIGGFLCPGNYYKNNICGVVSQLPKRNENGTWIITFWACHKPALTASAVSALGFASATAIPTKLGDLSDVDLTTAATDGQVLKASVSGETVTWSAADDATE